MWKAPRSANSVLVQALGTFALVALLLADVAAAAPDAECEGKALRAAKIGCYLEEAVSASQPELCERATEPQVKSMCLSLYAERTRDAGPCQRIAQASPEGQAMRDACLSGVAIARREPAGCEMVESPVIRDSCYMMLVVQFGADPKVCGQIRNETLKQACGE